MPYTRSVINSIIAFYFYIMITREFRELLTIIFALKRAVQLNFLFAISMGKSLAAGVVSVPQHETEIFDWVNKENMLPLERFCIQAN